MQILHDNVGMAGLLTDVKDLDDTGMTQVDQRLHFTRKTIEEICAGGCLVGGKRELDHDVVFEMTIAGQVD